MTPPPTTPTDARSQADRHAQADRRLAMLDRNRQTLDAIRARFGRSADPAALSALARDYAMPDWSAGAIGVLDACVLYDLIAAIRPARVIEVGTASGGSTATILRALHDAAIPLTDADGPVVRSYDLHPYCFSDRTRPVGSAVSELVPQLAHGVSFTTGTSIDAGRDLAGFGAQLAFIDAEHRHPWPTIDLLAILPALAPGAWVVVHDIDLPAAAARYEHAHSTTVNWHHAGAQWLFEAWPYESLAGLGDARNIGALAMPDHPITRARLRAQLADLIAQPCEIDPPPDAAALLAGDPP